jgi:hypothetical protein
MNNVSSISQDTDILMELLKSSFTQSTEMVEKLIKMNVQNLIDINQMENMGNIIDIYV